MRRRATNNASRFVLSPTQRTAITDVANTLAPAARHAFVLHVSQVLQLSAGASGFCTDTLVAKAIERALSEIEAAA